MSAGAAGAAGSPGAGAAGGDPGQGEALSGATGGGPDVGALTEQLQGLTAGQEEMRDFLNSQPWAAQEGDGDADRYDGDYDETFDGEGFDDEALDGDPYATDAQYDDGSEQIAAELADVFGAHLEQAVAPLHDEIDRIRQEREFGELAAEFPDLGDPQYVEPIFQAAADFGAVHGLPAHVAASPAMIRTLYLATKGLEAAREELELAQGQPPAAIEGGAGGGGGAPQAGDEMDRMLAPQAPGRRSLPFPG